MIYMGAPDDRQKRNCECEVCKYDLEFALSEDLLTDFLSGNVTIFAGAGISTESKRVLKRTFYESIADELGLDTSTLTFLQLMDKYCEQPNGRLKLLMAIKERFKHIDSFPELSGTATKFHEELATFFQVKNIVTTNWDTYFERYCNATPFVADPDLAFWDAASRRVLKIHGSIANFGSIVATTADYEKCKSRLDIGLLGGLLKTMLATQTVVFIGYSLSDPDFLSIYEFVRERMNSLHKQAYAVTPFKEQTKELERAGLIPIITDGTYFLKQIKKHAVNKRAMLDDGLYEAASDLLDRVNREHYRLHCKVKVKDHPELIYAASYQDGMVHALGRAVNMRCTGEYSNGPRSHRVMHAYLQRRQQKLRARNYEDVAYIDGYVNALTFLLFDRKDRKWLKPPLYYMFGSKSPIWSLTDFFRRLKRSPNAHRASSMSARRKVSKLAHAEALEFHHPPWL